MNTTLLLHITCSVVFCSYVGPAYSFSFLPIGRRILIYPFSTTVHLETEHFKRIFHSLTVEGNFAQVKSHLDSHLFLIYFTFFIGSS